MKWIYKIEENLIGTLMLFATAILFINVVLRYFFNANTTWAEEFIRFGMIWITFIGSSICFRRGMHVGIDLLLTSVSKSFSKWLQILISIISIVFMVFLVVYGTELVLFTKNSGQISPAMQIPLYWIFICIPLGAFLSIIHLLIIQYELITNKHTNAFTNTET